MKKIIFLLLLAIPVLLFNSCFEAQTEDALDSGGTSISAPTGVTASDGTYANQVEISWNPVSGASYYYIYRADTSTGSYTLIGYVDSIYTTAYNTTSSSSYPIESYTTYYYKVSAEDSNGNESDLSSADGGYVTRGSLKIINNSSSSVTGFYCEQGDSMPASYGTTNLFASSPLLAGYTIYYRFKPQQYINFRFEWSTYFVEKDTVESQISGSEFYIDSNETNTMLIGATNESTYYYYLSDFSISKRSDNSIEISEKIE